MLDDLLAPPKPIWVPVSEDPSMGHLGQVFRRQIQVGLNMELRCGSGSHEVRLNTSDGWGVERYMSQDSAEGLGCETDADTADVLTNILGKVQMST